MDSRFLVDELSVVNTPEFFASTRVNDTVWTCQSDGAVAIRARSGDIERHVGDHLNDAACAIFKRHQHVWVGYRSGVIRVFHAEVCESAVPGCLAVCRPALRCPATRDPAFPACISAWSPGHSFVGTFVYAVNNRLIHACDHRGLQNWASDPERLCLPTLSACL